uniref:Uncharacterized protein n=1 Tax=uncultured gamma proteobacterium EB080_L93H08 TaxID=710973 RepID=E0Y2K0_9GAMM|nr:hypothetical protein [uncultured gamma proteobacterium EB080_L93H08]
MQLKQSIYPHQLLLIVFVPHYHSQHIFLLAGQEGLEPPTCGFGDRRSTG